MYRAWFDASIKGNSITIGYTVLSPNNKLVKELGYKTESKKIKNIQSAESYALNVLLIFLVMAHQKDNVRVIGDCKHLIEIIANKVNNNKIYKLQSNIEIFKRNRNITLEWQERKFNTHTDNIADLAHNERVYNRGGKLII